MSSQITNDLRQFDINAAGQPKNCSCSVSIQSKPKLVVNQQEERCTFPNMSEIEKFMIFTELNISLFHMLPSAIMEYQCDSKLSLMIE